MMKIGIIKETKIPEDNRVVLTPLLARELKEKCNVEILVQKSETRSYSDKEYEDCGLELSDDLSSCDILLGIKEADINSIIPDKHYFFFGHIAKMQSYNRPLIKAMISRRLTFTDYEYLVDENNVRLCAFGWWAGVVGVYNTFRAYGLRYSMFELPKPDRYFTLEKLINCLKSVVNHIKNVKIIVTGNGRVSQGAQFVLKKIGIENLNEEQFFNPSFGGFLIADIDRLVREKENPDKIFDMEKFRTYPNTFESCFMQYAKYADILISCHYWSPEAPVYLTENDLKSKSMNIKVIGDITCDIRGSIKSTLRSSTHENPFYDYNPFTGMEESPFTSESNITVMAVDTLPNALARDTSEYFGRLFVDNVLLPYLKNKKTKVVDNATIIKNGELTKRFGYLSDFVK